MNKMVGSKNICIAYPNTSNYSETFIHNQVRLLKPQYEYFGTWYPLYNKERKPFLSFPWDLFYVRGIVKNLAPDFFHKKYTEQFTTEIKKNNIKTVLAEYGLTGCSLMDACKETGIPLFVHFHGFDASEYTILKKFGKRYNKMFSIAEKIIVVSEVMKNNLTKMGADKNKIINNPYGVDLSFFSDAHPGDNPPIFVAVGRFTEKKAPDLTIKAFNIVLKKIKNAKLIMVGDGELFEYTKTLVKELNISHAVDFKGVMDTENIRIILSQARTFVQHSVRAKNGDMEGTPNTILEAAAMGLPVVSTLHSGIQEAVINNKTGFLVSEGDYEKMAEYMILLGQNSKLADSMGKQARRHVELNYSLDFRINKLRDIVLSRI